MTGTVLCLIVSMIVVISISLIMSSGLKIIRPYEQGLLEVLGVYQRKLMPGLNWVPPLVSKVHRVDLRTTTLHIPGQDVFTRDSIPVRIETDVSIRVRDAKKAWYDIENYRSTATSLARLRLKTVLGNTEFDSLSLNRDKVNARLRKAMNKVTLGWGVEVVSVNIGVKKMVKTGLIPSVRQKDR